MNQGNAAAKRVKRLLLGAKNTDGLILKLIMYLALVGIGFVFVYPLLYMIAVSFMDLGDLINHAIVWLPSSFYLGNYQLAVEVMRFVRVLGDTLIVAATPSVLQTLAAAFIGYGLARFEFAGKRLILLLVLATFVVPPQVLLIPRHILFNELGFLHNIRAYVFPAVTGQGLNAAIFILIFFQNFRTLPKSLEEAAQLDGAGHFKVFATIALPLALPAIIVSLLFSFVWYWNETFMASFYLGDALRTLPLELERFVAQFNEMHASNQEVNINEGIEMAGTFLSILPLLIIFFVCQRWFVESVDKSGITGE
jgi:multiple sugar transport system permease protein